MTVVANQYGPVLRRIRELADTLRDHLAKAGLLSEPLPRQPGHRVPSHFHGARLPTDVDLPTGNRTRGLAQTQRLINL